MIKTVKLSSKGQFVIPEDIRKALKVKDGSALVAYTTGNKIILEKEEDFLKKIELIEEIQEQGEWKKLANSAFKDWSDAEEDKAWEHLQ